MGDCDCAVVRGHDSHSMGVRGNTMQFVRVESVQGDRIFAIFEISSAEYERIINERNEQAERERQNEMDWERERQWYRVEEE